MSTLSVLLQQKERMYSAEFAECACTQKNNQQKFSLILNQLLKYCQFLIYCQSMPRPNHLTPSKFAIEHAKKCCKCGRHQRVVNTTPPDAATGSKPPDHQKVKHWKTHGKSLENKRKSYSGFEKSILIHQKTHHRNYYHLL